MRIQISGRLPWGLALAAALLAVSGCDDDGDAPAPEPIRAIKYLTLSDRAGDQERRIAGVVSAAISTNVAFETAGQVIELLRKSGDDVAEDELIARLDPEPYRLRVAQAQSSLDQAEATLEDARRKFEQTRQLREEGFATQTAFDSAEATFKNAKGAVGVAESQLDLARRDLAKTDLRAPFSGVISRKQVDVFEEVTGGQPIYAIQTDGESKIEASLPETLINTVSLGDEVEVGFPPLGGLSVPGIVDEIAPLTGDVNAYPFEVKLLESPRELRAGMSAEVIFRFASAETGVAFVVPVGAIAPEPGQEKAHVFVFDPETETLAKREVTVANVRENSLLVVGDLTAGDIVAAAGVSFLHDGMTVRLLDPDELR